MAYSMKRCIHIDFHTMPGVTDFAKHIDAEATADLFASAHVTWVNLFARCNIGFSYYPTKIGIPYPGMQRDLLGELIEACHKRDIGVTAYLNIDLDHELFRLHPEYCRVNQDGSVLEQRIVDNNFYRSGCLNGAYRSYLMAEIREILTKDPDGIFCDCLIPKPCWCETCRAKMEKLGIDHSQPEQVRQFAFDTILEVAREIRATVPQNKRLFLNSFPYDRVADLCSHAELECLPSDTRIWGYDFFTTHAPYWRMFTDDRLYMTGRFGRSWGDYGGYRDALAMECDVYDALMYGYHPSVGDHMDPVYGLDARLYGQIGGIYEKVMALEPWTEGSQPVVEAAILRNQSAWNAGANASVKGAAKLLSEKKVCFNILDETMSFDGYRLLVLPNGLKMTPVLCQKLADFKGNILSCGTSCDTQGRWSFLADVQADDRADGFYDHEGRAVAMYVPAVKMRSARSVCSYIPPRFDRIWDGNHAYYYIPPGEADGCSAIAATEDTAHICFDIFRSYFENDAPHLSETVTKLLEKLLPGRLIEGELPGYARATLLRGELDLLQIKTTYPQYWSHGGRITDHVCLPAGRKVSVAGIYEKACAVPGGEPLAITVEEGRTVIELPQIEGYLAVALTPKTHL